MAGADSNFPVLSEETMTLLDATTVSSVHDSVRQLLEDDTMNNFFKDYKQYREEVRQGKHSKNLQFWLTYMDHIWLVLSLMYAVKMNDFELCAVFIGDA